MKLNLEQKIKAIRHLPDVRHGLLVEANIAAESLADLEAEFAQRKAAIEAALDAEGWRSVESNWSESEIAEAAK